MTRLLGIDCDFCRAVGIIRSITGRSNARRWLLSCGRGGLKVRASLRSVDNDQLRRVAAGRNRPEADVPPRAAAGQIHMCKSATLGIQCSQS